MECTLWRIFDCLVDAISVLEFGDEVKYDSVKQVAGAPNPHPEFKPIVHFDIKPENGKSLWPH